MLMYITSSKLYTLKQLLYLIQYFIENLSVKSIRLQTLFTYTHLITMF